MANVASAQTLVRPSSKEMETVKKSTFDSFWERVKISYTGVLTTPHLDDIEKGQWYNAAVSPEYGNAPKGDQKNHDTWPANLWHQLSFRYRFGGKMDFIINPRFMTPLATSRDMKYPEERSLVMIDDTVVGFQGVVYTSDDKAFNYFLRLGIRLPTSRPSRNSGQGGSGTLSHVNDVAMNTSYNLNKTWQIGMYNNFRQYVIDDRWGFHRFRIYSNPYVQYTIDDASNIQVYYENMIEADKRRKPMHDRKPVFKDKWQNVTIGYARDITPKFNLNPFMGVFINDTPVTDKSIWFGANLSYAIK